MKIRFIEYPSCTTCKRAKKWLTNNGHEFESQHIVDNTPTPKELTEWFKASELPLRRFFNTSGKIYRELNLKEKLLRLTEKEQIKLLASNGMLIKRPLLIADNKVLVGFKEEEWETKLK